MSQVNYEKMARSLEEQLSEAKSKGDSLTKEVNELNGTKAKLSSENGEQLDKTIVIYVSTAGFIWLRGCIWNIK